MGHAAPIKPGAKCATVKKTAKSARVTYTCVKVGSKLVWKRTATSAVVTPMPVPTIPSKRYFASPCVADPLAPAEWQTFQSAIIGIRHCPGVFRLVETRMPAERPATALSDAAQLLPVERCKVANPMDAHIVVGWPQPGSKHARQVSALGPNTVFQVVPIYSSDAPTVGRTPLQDYGKYFTWLERYLEYASDGRGDVQFRVPEAYIRFPQPIAPFGVNHLSGPAGSMAFSAALKPVAEAAIDFRGSTFSIVVVPRGTPLTVVGQSWVEGLGSSHGTTGRGSIFFPDSDEPWQNVPMVNLRTPNMWLHEMVHANNWDLGDQYGPDDPGQYTDASVSGTMGMGQWGMMATGQTDFLVWHKWLLGLTADSQVRCAATGTKTTHWLAPSGMLTDQAKLLVVPLSGSKALVVESQRAIGFNFKLPQESEGALVYVVDGADQRHGYGLQAVWKAGLPIPRTPFLLYNIPLKRGETLVAEGYRVTVVESGDFGDVVRVEPAA